MENKQKTRKNPALDLFGGVVVTWEEVDIWMERVAQLPKSSPRWAYYVKFWDVPERIKAAKLAGTFDQITG